ncbi:ankyrin repeat domain-containing protein [Legionella tucsonensis]|uniref:Phosphatase n=1 Tax=Legionella tucsonensis TaxID=40335 RepID=A0A0W0ZWM3_9GAMM|nr:ankyrin repeat domain-containing protein [Legionella tucsonensis]KTD73486.1 phosphatase [Legionella tucsonensis]
MDERREKLSESSKGTSSSTNNVIYVKREDIEYVFNSWLKEPYIKVNSDVAFDAQMQKEKMLFPRLDLSLESYSKSKFYTERSKSGVLVHSAQLCDIMIDKWGKVNRPNHGLGHTLRTAAYIPMVVEEFKKHHPEYEHLKEEDIKKIQYLALFSIVGRLNECGWADSLTTYSYFRWRSGEIFYDYMMQTIEGEPRYKSLGFKDEEEVNHYKQQLLEMGEPNNKDPIHVILNTAHKIDLMRCSSKSNPFKGRFDDYLKEFLPIDSIQKLRDVGETLIIQTGEHIQTGETNDYDRNREGSLFEPCERDIDFCLRQIDGAFSLKASKESELQPFVAKATGAYRFNQRNFFDFFDDMTRDPEQHRNPKYRPIQRKPYGYTVKDSTRVERIGDKNPATREEDKDQATYITSATYIDPGSKTPLFGHELENWRFLVGVAIDPKDAFFNRFIRKDINTYTRPLDFQSKDTANDFTQTQQREPKERAIYDNLTEFKEVVKEDAKKNVHNEVMVRMRWNCDGTSRVCIFADTLEARLTAQHYAEYLQDRIHRSKNAVGYYEDYQVPIQFYTPHQETNGRFYTRSDYKKDKEEALAIFNNETLKKAYFDDDNYVFLLGLDSKSLSKALMENVNGQPIWIKMISSHNNYMLEMLLSKLDPKDDLMVLKQTFKQYKLNTFDDQFINEIVQYGYINSLNLFNSIGYRQDYIKKNIDNLLNLSIENGRSNIFAALKDLSGEKKYQENVENYLLMAIKHRQLAAFQFLLNDVKKPLNPEFLVAAAETGDAKLVKMLFARGLDANAANDLGTTALHGAAKSGKNSLVRLFLSRENIEVKNKKGETPLHFAARAGNDHTVELLIKSGANINVKDNSGKTPLHWAIESKNINLIKFLIQEGADIDATDIYNRSPIDHAIYYYEKDTTFKPIVIELLKEVQDKPFILSFSQPGLRSLFYDLIEGVESYKHNLEYMSTDVVNKVQFINKLAEKLQYIPQSDPVNIKTPLHHAAEMGQAALIEGFAKNAKHHINAQNEKGQTPLHLAAMSESPFAINELIKNGADLNIKDERGFTPLDYAIKSAHWDSITVLIKNGAKFDSQEFLKEMQRFKNENSEYCEKFDSLIKAVEKLESQLVTKQSEKILKPPFSVAKKQSVDFLMKSLRGMLDPDKDSSLYKESTKALEDALMFSLLKEQYGGKRLRGRSIVLGHLLDFVKNSDLPIEPGGNLDCLVKKAELLQSRKKQVGSFITHLAHLSVYNREQEQVIELINKLNKGDISKEEACGKLIEFVSKDSEREDPKKQCADIKDRLQGEKSKHEENPNPTNLTELP